MLKKILITGASGLCGSHINAYLRSKKNRYSVHTTSRRDILKKNHIIYDLQKPINLDVFPQKVDCIIHSAANVDESDLSYNVINDNLRSSYNVLKYALETKPECFINLSSISVYGKPKTNFAIDEDYPPQPMSSYGFSKLLVETLSESMLSRITRVISLRLGYVLSQQIPNRYFIIRFKNMFLEGKPIQLINPDSTRFSFIDVHDVARTCEEMVNKDHSGCFNLVGDETPNLREVFEEIRNYFPKNLSVITELEREKTVFPTIFSNEKIKQIIDFSFTSYRISLKNIIENV